MPSNGAKTDPHTLVLVPARVKARFIPPMLLLKTETLLEQAHSPKGVHFASYARDGEVRTGSFATKPPSEDELALRQRQAEGRW